MAGKLAVTFADYGGEKSTFQVNTLVVNAGNFAANDTLMTSLIASANALVDGLQVKETRQYSAAGTGQGASSVPTAQRELKWLITFSDDVNGELGNRELPCPLLDATTILTGVEGNANLSDSKWVTFIADFEALVLSKESNPVTVVGARLVGRNN